MTLAVFMLAAFLDNLYLRLHGGITFWTVFGLTGNILFTSRFVVQWYASERLKQSVIPKNFWHLSLVGGVIQLIYALHLGAVPIILGYLLPPVIAARNLVLIARHGQPPQGRPGAPLPDDASAAPTAVERTPGEPDEADAPDTTGEPGEASAPGATGEPGEAGDSLRRAA